MAMPRNLPEASWASLHVHVAQATNGGTWVTVTAGRWSLNRARRADSVLLEKRWDKELQGPEDLATVALWAVEQLKVNYMEALRAATK